MPDSSKKTSEYNRRIAPRIPSCRPCLIWEKDAPDDKKKGVIMNLNRYGLRIRTFEDFKVGQEIFVQMMKDEEYKVPLGIPILNTIVYSIITPQGFIDYGLKRVLSDIKKLGKLGHVEIRRPGSNPRAQTRMYILETKEGKNK